MDYQRLQVKMKERYHYQMICELYYLSIYWGKVQTNQYISELPPMISLNSQFEPNLYRQVKRDRKYVPPHKLLDATVTSSIEIISKNAVRPQKNYIASNKKKLHNFFIDRLEQDTIGIKDKQVSFSPSKILEYRKEQGLKQSATKMQLKSSMELPYAQPTAEIRKMTQTFSTLSKVRARSRPNKFKLDLNESVTNASLSKSYQTATHSSLVKRCETAKKRAYISVFGNDSNAASIPINPEIEKKNFPNKTVAMRKKTEKLQKDKQKFRSLISKIKAYSVHLKQNESEGEDLRKDELSRQTTQDQVPEITQVKSQMLTGIKDISGKYKVKIENLQFKKVKEIEDMEPEFVEAMKKQKDARLRVRNQALTAVSLNPDQLIQVMVDQSYQRMSKNRNQEQRYQEDSERNFNADFQGMLTITDRNKNTIQELETIHVPYQTKRKFTLKEKLACFAVRLLKTNTEALMFGIEKEKLHIVLWKVWSPFELEGSYAFFKLIKTGDLSMIKNFILQNPNYAYQVDHEGRTSLIYAVQNGRLEIVKYLIGLGFNINKETYLRATALYYAIKTDNYPITLVLLENGASPWSTKTCNLQPMVDLCSKKVKVALKNARRVQMACELTYKFSQRLEVWSKMKHKIKSESIINFQ